MPTMAHMGHDHSATLFRVWDPPSDTRHQAGEAAATWTLISLDEQGRLARVWHQHGEGATPVPLEPESVAAGDAPSITARAYACEECDELTVVSRPAPALS
jgi:hypothetical protein